MDDFSALFFNLTYHRSERIREISKYLLKKLSQKGRVKTLLMRLFSVSEEERKEHIDQLFKANRGNILKSIEAPE